MSDAPQDATARNGRGNQRDQTAANLQASAEGGLAGAAAAGAPLPVRMRSARVEAVMCANSLNGKPPAYTCMLRLQVAVFFDGTGNNLDADIGTSEHSNVARLFRSHQEQNPAAGIFAFYVPGLGTYFPDIGDPGDEDGLAFGKRGEPRLDWAMRKIDEAVARHPPANIVGLDIALFGFSRGAALARAFARRIQGRCKTKGATWAWDKGGFDAAIYFMGLFDTVASVGLPASSSLGSVRIAKGWVTLDKGLEQRRHSASNGVEPYDGEKINLGIAFGTAPGADPTPGLIDGHGSWAGNLRVPPMVAKCVHFVAAHEVRNSFPLDSARDGQAYATSVDERVYPGVHSNVGGGYRPGEGGRSMKAIESLSLLPLLAMHDEAISAGVPLSPKTDPRSGDDFKLSPQLAETFNAYVARAEAVSGNKTLEARVLGNMRLYYAWRFKCIRDRGQQARPDAAQISTEESKYAAERKQLDREIAAAEQDPVRLQAQQDAARADREAERARSEVVRLSAADWPNSGALSTALERQRQAEAAQTAAQVRYVQADDVRMKLMARRATLGGDGLVSRLDLYDRNLLLDVQAIQNVRKSYPRARVRPHYENLLAAYEAEFIHQKGLLCEHPELLAMFDNYVHDSLAGFAKDQTLPSDPRVIYVGGDAESEYARNELPSHAGQTAQV